MEKVGFLDYLKYQKHYSENTITNYDLDITKYEQYIKINDVDYRNITYQQITDYMGYLKKTGLSASSISRNLSCLRSLYNYFLKNNLVKTNSFKLISGIKKDKKLPNFLQYNEFEDILKSCGEDDLGIRNRSLLELLIASGLRVSEITNIKLNDISLKEKSIKVVGKGNKERIVYFGEYAQGTLNKYLDYSRENLLKKKENDYLFINHIGNKLTTRGVGDIIERLLDKTAIEKKVSPHTFRHSFATMLINEGANTKVVQELLGHSSIGTTSIYTHLSNDKLRSEYLKTHPRARKVGGVMGSLIVNYGVMGSSKSSAYMTEAHNFEAAKKKVVLMKPEVDKKGDNKIVSRLAGEYKRPVDVLINENETIIESCLRNGINLLKNDAIMIDEAQFITHAQAYELWLISKKTKLQIICFSLGTDFSANFFPGSETLLAYADEKNELIRRCENCALKPAIFNARMVNEEFVSEGDQVVIDGLSVTIKYVSLCGDCFYKLVKQQNQDNKKIDEGLKEMQLILQQ